MFYSHNKMYYMFHNNKNKNNSKIAPLYNVPPQKIVLCTSLYSYRCNTVNVLLRAAQ